MAIVTISLLLLFVSLQYHYSLSYIFSNHFQLLIGQQKDLIFWRIASVKISTDILKRYKTFMLKMFPAAQDILPVKSPAAQDIPPAAQDIAFS